ncbi:MAG: hypothetical protein ACRD4E_12770, partial [Bryobacteraceae bacterium]
AAGVVAGGVAGGCWAIKLEHNVRHKNTGQILPIKFTISSFPSARGSEEPTYSVEDKPPPGRG